MIDELAAGRGCVDALTNNRIAEPLVKALIQSGGVKLARTFGIDTPIRERHAISLTDAENRVAESLRAELLRIKASSKTIRTARARSSSGYRFPKFFFSITQYPYFWVSGKQGAVHTKGLIHPARVKVRGCSLIAGERWNTMRDKMIRDILSDIVFSR